MKLDIKEGYRITLTINDNNTELYPNKIKIFIDETFVGGQRYIQFDFGVKFEVKLDNYTLKVNDTDISLNVELSKDLEKQMIEFYG